MKAARSLNGSLAGLTLLAATFGVGGCASVFDSKDQSTILVDSNPQGATVRLNGMDKGVTPAELVV
ncbi:MAG: PEGA domain-containing protein, partial [Planctomycetota bacterium]